MSDLIGYEAFTRKAMRGVVRDTLEKVRQEGGLPGDHHFYISFKTKGFGVKIPPQLLARFPDVMTIVVQYQYWDLEVTDRHFEIVLKFGGVPQHLYVPFHAITRFADPSVNFGLVFEEDEMEADTKDAGESAAPKIEPLTGAEPSQPAKTDDPTGKKAKPATIVRLDTFRQNKG